MKISQLIKVITFCMLFSLNMNLSAQEGVLTLEKSIELALSKNPEFQIAQKEWQKSKKAIWEAYSAILPSVDANFNFQHAWNIQTSVVPNFLKPLLLPLAPMIPELQEMPDEIEFSFGLRNTFTYGAMLTQPLFLGGAGIAGIKMAYNGERAAKLNYESKRQNLIYQVSNAFYGCLLAKNLVQVQTEALEQAEKNFENVKKRYEVGSASGFERMRAEVEVANLKPELIAAKNNYQASLTGFRMIIGLESHTAFELQGNLEYVYDEYDGIPLEELQVQALEHRPEIQTLDAQKNLATNGLMLARSQFLPKLFFSTDYSFLAMRGDTKFTQDDFSKGFTSALSLQIPIFHGFKNCKQYQSAVLDYKITQDLEKQILDGIRAEIEIAYNDFHEASQKYHAALESIELAEESLRLANLTYEEGASTQLDVLSSQLAFTRSKLNYASALYDYQMARYRIRKVTGMLNSIL
jgi:outer membrane protein